MAPKRKNAQAALPQLDFTARTPHHGDLVQRKGVAYTYQIIHIGPRRQDGHPLPDARRQADQLRATQHPHRHPDLVGLDGWSQRDSPYSPCFWGYHDHH